MTECRKTVTLYDDQYRFFKSFHSEKLLIAFVEYMFEDKEPEGLNEQEQVIFDSLRVRMENQKKKQESGSKGGKNSHGGGRPKNNEETTEKQTKEQQKNKQKTSTKQANNKQDKDISKSISISNKENNISISNDIETETKVSERGNHDINQCLSLIKSYNNGIIDGTQDSSRKYSKLLIDKLKKLESVQNGKFTRFETLEIILKVVSQNKFQASKITSPELIYRNLAILMQTCKNDITKQQSNNIVLETI